MRNFWLIKQWQQGMATAMTRTSKFPFRFLYFPRLVSICLRCLCKFSIWIMEKGHFMPLLELWTPHHALPRHGSARPGPARGQFEANYCKRRRLGISGCGPGPGHGAIGAANALLGCHGLGLGGPQIHLKIRVVIVVVALVAAQFRF